MESKIIPIGTKLGDWTVKSGDVKEGRRIRVLCQCDCGKEILVSKTNLICGRSKRCKICSYPKNQTKHGKAYNKLYQVCYTMKARCENPKNASFKNYGGRKNPIRFNFKSPIDAVFWIEKNLGKSPGKEYSLDRINNDGHYEPGNLRWATRKMQRENTRDFIGISGEKYIIQESPFRFIFRFPKKKFSKPFKTKEEAVKFRDKFLSERDSFHDPRN